MDKKMGLIFVFLLLAGLFALFFAFFNQSAEPRFPIVVQNCENIDRSSYGVSSLTFSGLPMPPACFYSVVKPFQTRSFSDAYFFSREYYLQPEFFPNFLENGLSAWTNADENRHGIVGFGAFPAEQTVFVQPGQSVRVRVFVHSGFGVRTFQGMRIVSAGLFSSEELSVSLDEASARGFVLGPTFPVFDSNWVHPVDVFVSAPLDSKPRVVDVFLQTTEPLFAAEQSFVSSPSYYASTQYIGTQTLARVTIKVTDPSS